MRVRGIVFGLAVLALAAPAAALEPADLAGAWVTQWANNGGEAISGGGPLIIRAESADSLDGLQPSSGLDGMMNGEVSAGENGALVWSGVWASVWPEGATQGTFRLVFTGADSFTGVWSSSDGAVRDAAWTGVRAP